MSSKLLYLNKSTTLALNDSFNSEYQEFLIQKGMEEVTLSVDDTFTLEEYYGLDSCY